MDKSGVLAFAKALGLRKINSTKRAGWIVFSCPFARRRHKHGVDTEPSCGIKWKAKRPFFTCFSCHEHGDLEDLLLKLAVLYRGNTEAAKLIMAAREVLDKQDAVLKIGGEVEEQEVDEIIEWPEWLVSAYQPAYEHPYLASRAGGAVPRAVAERMDFRLDAKRQRLGVPIRDFDGRLMGFHARTLVGAKPPYLAYRYQGHWNKPIWLGEDKVDLTKPVLIVESVFDMARAVQCYRNTVSPLMSGIPKSKLDRLSQALRLVVMMDDDEAGRLGLQKIKNGLPDTTVVPLTPPPGYNDPGETPVNALAARLSPHLKLDPIIY